MLRKMCQLLKDVEKMNVLAPYFACFFALMKKKLRSLRCGRQPKSHHCMKEVRVLDPNNNHMLAVS